MNKYDLVIVGAGAAGMLCAVNAKKHGIQRVLIIDKDPVLGGSLNGCTYTIDKDRKITGNQYLAELTEEFKKHDIKVLRNTMVLKIDEHGSAVCLNSTEGLHKIVAKNIILCNGAKEKGRNSIAVTGDRCAGILNVTMAKKIFAMNMIPGKNILFCGDDGIKRIINEIKKSNVNVVGVVGENSYGLTDNIFNGYEISGINGRGRVEEAILTKGDESLKVKCDTVIFAYARISDGIVAMRSGIDLNPLTTGPRVDKNYMTSRENIYACGDGIFIHEYIDDIENECENLIRFVFDSNCK